MEIVNTMAGRILIAGGIAAAAMLGLAAPSLAQRDVQSPGAAPPPPQPSSPRGAVSPGPPAPPQPTATSPRSSPPAASGSSSRRDRSARSSDRRERYSSYDRHRYYDDDRWRRPDWRYDYSRRYYDRDRWRHGRWYHGPYRGHTAWWWIIDDDWYAYSQPVYPYPDPDAAPPPVYYDPNVVVVPAVPAPPPAPQAPPGMYYDPYSGQMKPLPGTTSYYYCYSPAGYYPQVLECPSGWVAVPPG